jgi:hypothetical protein
MAGNQSFCSQKNAAFLFTKLTAMPHHPHTFLPGASKRLEALSDGIFAIACTLLVLEIKIPELHGNWKQQWHSIREHQTLESVGALFLVF